ncbi:hypothetical protein [Bradyrhizobium sp. 150]|uniref:hypothetical protein n=1 Tax=Bradyrhizobium sp. 150 TaxID=2782625 RepID=UPI001FFA2898|nr:hypothetical protein [Bradyrhizobium sp. 150]MCK1671042.1 hypothetical protein [Bradyrhizobium sp. 150]
MRQYDNTLVITIRGHLPEGTRQAQNRLLRWLETYGHTSVGHGFDFLSVGVMTGKRVERRDRETT